MSKHRINETVRVKLTSDVLGRMSVVDAILVELNRELSIGDGRWCEIDGRLYFREEQQEPFPPKLVAALDLRNAHIKPVARRYPYGSVITEVTLRRIDDFSMQWVAGVVR